MPIIEAKILQDLQIRNLYCILQSHAISYFRRLKSKSESVDTNKCVTESMKSKSHVVNYTLNNKRSLKKHNTEYNRDTGHVQQ